MLTDKYQPHSFSDIIGNAHSLSSIRRLCGEPGPLRVMFCGPKGVGKTITAKILGHSLAKNPALNMTLLNGTKCTQDWIERILESELMMFGFDGGFRVWIIDELESVTPGAAKVLRTVLREGMRPKTAILATTNQNKDPQGRLWNDDHLRGAIWTRFTRYQFDAVPASEIAPYLRMIARLENQDGKADDFYMSIAKQSGGNVADAIGLLEESFEER